ncbi:sulfite exporter TauE/SafE family protein [Thermodesulfobacteriota bacterium]
MEYWIDIMHFSVSGIEISPFIPFIVAFVISFFTSMGGVSGAFLLLPFQVSILGFTSPSVSSTNLVYNIVAIPSGVYRYIREGRMAWPLAWVIIAGTLPGLFAGVIIRIKYFPDAKNFKFFIGCVLIYIAFRLLYDLTPWGVRSKARTLALEDKFKESFRNNDREYLKKDSGKSIKTLSFSITRYSYEFYGEEFSFNTIVLFILTLIVGLIGGIYGIGGGAIIAPFLIAIFGLPVYTISGAALLGTFVTSIFGVLIYTLIAPVFDYTGLSIIPDWKLGVIFGAGGFLGIYFGARFQKYFPARIIKLILGCVIMFLSLKYIIDFF